MVGKSVFGGQGGNDIKFGGQLAIPDTFVSLAPNLVCAPS